MRKIRTLLLLMAACVSICALSRPANTTAVQVQQPDGTTLTLRLVGDEFYHFNTTSDGYTVMLNHAGAYVYAQPMGNTLIATSVVAHDPDQRTKAEQALLAGIDTHAVDHMAIEQSHIQRAKRDEQRLPAFDFSDLRGLVILINFTDVSFTMDDPVSFYDKQFNEEGYDGYVDDDGNTVRCTGSVCDYFSDQSNGAFKPKFDVYGPVASPYKSTQGNSQYRNIFRNAIKTLDSEIDYSKYDADGDGKIDMVYFIVAGYSSSFGGNSSSYLWPHKSYLSGTYDGMTLSLYACSTELYGWESSPSSVTIEGIGTICHEFSHVLGLPDLYDTDYTSNGQTHHPGEWDIMAGGSDFNYGRTPVGYSLYDKYSLNWAIPTVINSEGSYTLNPLNTSHEGYMIKTPQDKEVFLLENRQRSGWDAYLPGHGMLVVRMDSTNASIWTNNKVNCYTNHMYYEILRAGGSTADATGSDPYPGTSGNVMISNTTTPNLKTWAGYENDWNITGISETDGVITFNVVANGSIKSLVEDFELMTANTSTSDKDVQGNFATWSFTKSGVRAPGEGKCNGTNAVMMKLPSLFYSTSPIYYDINQVSATVFNSSAYTTKYSLEYSVDGGSTWTKVASATGDNAEVASQTQATVYWTLDIKKNKPTQFRFTQVGGNKSSAVYIDDFTVYYTGEAGGPSESIIGDVNGDGEVTIADVNAIIDLILASGYEDVADVNEDGEVTIADVNAVIDIILSAGN